MHYSVLGHRSPTPCYTSQASCSRILRYNSTFVILTAPSHSRRPPALHAPRRIENGAGAFLPTVRPGRNRFDRKRTERTRTCLTVDSSLSAGSKQQPACISSSSTPSFLLTCSGLSPSLTVRSAELLCVEVVSSSGLILGMARKIHDSVRCRS